MKMIDQNPISIKYPIWSIMYSKNIMCHIIKPFMFDAILIKHIMYDIDYYRIFECVNNFYVYS